MAEKGQQAGYPIAPFFMAEKVQQAGYPMAPANVYGRSDVEAAGDYSDDELRRQKRNKCIRYVVAFAIFQLAVISLFSMTVMKVKTPKFRVSSAGFGSFNVQTASPPSFNLMMNAELGVKNTNFGPYKFDSTTIYFYYGSSQVGSALIPNSKAGFKSTKKFTVAVDLTSVNLPSNSNLATDLASGILSLTSQSTLTGKVELMMIMKKKKTVNMNCTMDVNITTKELQNLTCN